jgi:Methyltransferase domain
LLIKVKLTPYFNAPRRFMLAEPLKCCMPKPKQASQTSLADILRPGQSIALLQHLHILTVEGKLNQDTRRKLKQVNHLLQFIEPLIVELRQQGVSPNIVDHGAGKSYLGFLLYDALFKTETGSVWGIESRADLITTTVVLAKTLGFERMGFVMGDTSLATEAHLTGLLPEQVHIVTALHACNTATDDAIRFGLAKQAPYMVLVPCCQAEVAAQLRTNKTKPSSVLAALWQRPVHIREFGSQLTNVLRCLQLEAAGYQVTVTELVGWEHSLKNELIIAKRIGKPSASARAQLEAILDETHLQILKERFL